MQLVKTKVPKIEVEETMLSDREEAWFQEVVGEVCGPVRSPGPRPRGAMATATEHVLRQSRNSCGKIETSPQTRADPRTTLHYRNTERTID